MLVKGATDVLPVFHFLTFIEYPLRDDGRYQIWHTEGNIFRRRHMASLGPNAIMQPWWILHTLFVQLNNTIITAFILQQCHQKSVITTTWAEMLASNNELIIVLSCIPIPLLAFEEGTCIHLGMLFALSLVLGATVPAFYHIIWHTRY